MNKTSYSEKLRDPRWQKKRLEALNANDFTCELCGDNTSPLHVHHKEYLSKKVEPWQYDVRQLAVLCDACHDAYHSGNGFDMLKFICSFADMDGPTGRDDAAVVLAGFLGAPYAPLLKCFGMPDLPHFQKLYKDGEKAQRYVGNTNNRGTSLPEEVQWVPVSNKETDGSNGR